MVVDTIKISDMVYTTNNRSNGMATLNQHYSIKATNNAVCATRGLVSEIINDYLSGK